MVTDREMKYWKQISLSYMTEESDDAENDGILITHKLLGDLKVSVYNGVFPNNY